MVSNAEYGRRSVQKLHITLHDCLVRHTLAIMCLIYIQKAMHAHSSIWVRYQNPDLQWPLSTRHTSKYESSLCIFPRPHCSPDQSDSTCSKTHTANSGKHLTFHGPIIVLPKQMETCPLKQLLQHIL